MIFVDTSAWVALYAANDRHHQKAKNFWGKLRTSQVIIVSTLDIFSETVTVIRLRADLSQAVAFGQAFLESPAILKVASDETAREEAWKIFRSHQDKTLSFIDCLSFAIMNRRGIKHAFSFDDDFHQFGFKLNDLSEL